MQDVVYSPDYVRSLLDQLDDTLNRPDPWSRMTLDELVAVAETLVRLDCRNEHRLLQSIDSLVVSLPVESIDAKNLSKLLNSYAHLGFTKCRLIEYLKLRKSLSDMEPCHISGIMFALGKLKVAGGHDLDDLYNNHHRLGSSLNFLEHLTQSELSAVLHRLSVRSFEVVDRFSPLEISTVVFAMARLNYRNVKLLNYFSEILANRLIDSTPQIISNTIYAMGKLGFRSLVLLDTVARTCPSRLAQFKPQEIANLVYAFGQLEYRNETFLTFLADHIPPRLASFKPQELSITAYAYSQLRLCHPRMLGSIAIQIARRIDDCSPQAISNTIYAMSKLNFRHNGLFTALAISLPQRLGDLTPQHVSNIMYSFGKLGHRDDELLGKICSHVPTRLWEFRPQNIANTVYATGKLGFYHAELLSAVAEHLPYRLTECVSQDISNIIYSFGQLGFKNCDGLLKSVRDYVVGVLLPSGGMQAKDLSYLTSAFRKAGSELILDTGTTTTPADQDEPITRVVASLLEGGGNGTTNEDMNILLSCLEKASTQ